MDLGVWAPRDKGSHFFSSIKRGVMLCMGACDCAMFTTAQGLYLDYLSEMPYPP